MTSSSTGPRSCDRRLGGLGAAIHVPDPDPPAPPQHVRVRSSSTPPSRSPQRRCSS